EGAARRHGRDRSRAQVLARADLSRRDMAMPRSSAMTVDRATAVSLYQQIADRLKAEIAGGAFATDGRLPAEREFMTRFGVSRVTVRQAMAQLLRDGQVVRKQGKGTFVAGQ